MPCTGTIQIKEKFSAPVLQHHVNYPFSPKDIAPANNTDDLGGTVFQRNLHDDKPALSVEDGIFLEITDRDVYTDEENHWVAPLPFRLPRRSLPENRNQALKCLTILQCILQRKAKMQEQFFNFMQKIFDNDQAEAAPPLKPQ